MRKTFLEFHEKPSACWVRRAKILQCIAMQYITLIYIILQHKSVQYITNIYKILQVFANYYNMLRLFGRTRDSTKDCARNTGTINVETARWAPCPWKSYDDETRSRRWDAWSVPEGLGGVHLEAPPTHYVPLRPTIKWKNHKYFRNFQNIFNFSEDNKEKPWQSMDIHGIFHFNPFYSRT